MSEPGWHPDPWKAHQSRYWDGTEWTSHVHDDDTAAGPPSLLPVAVEPAVHSAAPVPAPIPAPSPIPAPMPFAGAGTGQVVNTHVHFVNAAPAKSKGVAFALTFFFGPLGMFYSTVPGALVMLGVTFLVLLLSVLTLGLGLVLFLVVWPAEIIWAVLACDQQRTPIAVPAPVGPQHQLPR